MAVSRHHAAVGRPRRGSVAVAAGSWKRSACSRKSARPLPRCSAPRSERSRGSSRAGTASCAGRSRDVAPGTSVSDCRRNFWMDWTNCCAMRPALIALDKPPVILTGEYIPENFLLSRDGSGWHLAGLFDFGDVMTGRGEYDLLGPSAFMTAGMPRRVRRLFEGFGYSSRRHQCRPEAAVDGADAAASGERSRPGRSASRAGSRRRPTCSNCRICSGRSETPHSKRAVKISALYCRQICIFVCNPSGCRTPEDCTEVPIFESKINSLMPKLAFP